MILRPNWFMDNFHTSWLAPIQQAGVIHLPAAGARTSFIDARDIAASEAAGREIRYVPVDDESFIQSLVDAGVPADLARYLAALFEFVRQGATAAVSPAVEELTGRAPRSLAQYARDHASMWRSKD